MASNENNDIEVLKSRIEEQGNLVRKLKSDTNNNKVCHKHIYIFILIDFYFSFLGGSHSCC
jgi:hypothetical protein